MRKKDHEARLVKRATELAQSGRFKGWFYVAVELQVQHGEPLAMQILDSEPLKSDLDRICIQAKKRRREERNAAWTERPEETG